MKTYKFQVEMSCQGCSNAINRVLSKHKDQGISNFVIDLEKQTVEIESTKTLEELQEILTKTGKKVTFLEEK